MEEIELSVSDGRRLHAYAHGTGPHTVMWHHGTPNVGTPPAPLFEAAERLGVRFISYDRPGYGGSTARPDRTIASAAGDAAAVADAFGVDRFAVLGHSGGGPHALACAALLPGRVTAAVSISGLAPFADSGPAPLAGEKARADSRDGWFTGMGPASEASLRAAVRGRAAKEAHEATESEPDFTADDWAALEGPWGWFGSVVTPAVANGPAALIDDDLAYVKPWGFAPEVIAVPTLLVHGTADRMVPARHSERLAALIPGATLKLVEGEGHISVLPAAAEDALYFSSVGS